MIIFFHGREDVRNFASVREDLVLQAKTFKSTKINVTLNGKSHLGAAIDSRSYKEDYINEKIDQWIKEVKLLSEIAKIEPQCTLSCFISGYKHKLN